MQSDRSESTGRFHRDERFLRVNFHEEWPTQRYAQVYTPPQGPRKPETKREMPSR